MPSYDEVMDYAKGLKAMGLSGKDAIPLIRAFNDTGTKYMELDPSVAPEPQEEAPTDVSTTIESTPEVFAAQKAEAAKTEAEAQAIERGEDFSVVDPLITRQARASFARGDISAPLQAAVGILGVPARTLGKLFGKGKLSDQETGLLKDQRLQLQEKMASMSDAPQQILSNLKAKRDEIEARSDLGKSKKEEMLRLLDEAMEKPKFAKFDQEMGKIVDNILLVSMSVAEDPMTFLEGGLGVAGKAKAATPIGEFAEEVVEQQAKVAKKAGRSLEEISDVMQLGGPEEIAKKVVSGVFVDEGGKLGIKREFVNNELSRLVKPQKGVSFGGRLDEIPDAQLINIPEFDRVKDIERGFDINTEDFINDLFASTNPNEIKRIVDDLSIGTDVQKELADKTTKIASELSTTITGDKARDVIMEINALVDFSKSRKSDIENALLSLQGKLKDRLSDAASAKLGPEQFELYEELLGKASEAQRLRRNLLDQVLGKGKSQFGLDEVALDEANDKLRKIVSDAGRELSEGEGVSKANRLRKIEQAFGVELKDKAINYGFAKKLGLFPDEATISRVKRLREKAKATQKDLKLLPGGFGISRETRILQSLNFLKKLVGKDKSLATAIKDIQKLNNKDPRKLLKLSNLLKSVGVSEDMISQAFPRE